MAHPTPEGNLLFDFKGFHQLLQAAPLWAIADHGEVGQTISQKGRSRAQSKITSLPGNQAAHENQIQFGIGLRTARVVQAHGATDAGLGDKKQLITILGKLGIRLGGSGYDRCCIAIGGASKRQKSIQIPQVGNPFLLVPELDKTRRPG